MSNLTVLNPAVPLVAWLRDDPDLSQACEGRVGLRIHADDGFPAVAIDDLAVEPANTALGHPDRTDITAVIVAAGGRDNDRPGTGEAWQAAGAVAAACRRAVATQPVYAGWRIRNATVFAMAANHGDRTNWAEVLTTITVSVEPA